MRVALLLCAAVVLTGASWIDPHAKAREASALYDKGDFEAATRKYNEALTDEPDSYLLQYNRGASLYREKKFEDAAAAFGRAPAADPAETAYNVGNAKYRLGAAAAESDPQKAIGLYAEALAAYRRAMGARPDDADAKFNHELVEKKLEELRKKLEEQEQEQQQDQQQQESDQQQQQNEQPHDQQDQQNQQDQAQQDQQRDDQQQSQQQQEQQNDQQAEQSQPQQRQEDAAQQQKEQQQAAGENEAGERQQPAESAVSGEKREGEMSEREARALLDAARDQEVRPEEIIERMQGAAVLEPSQDW